MTAQESTVVGSERSARLQVSAPRPLAAELLGLPGVDVHAWDLDGPPPSPDLEAVILPLFHFPAVAELQRLSKLRAVLLSTSGWDHVVPAVPAGAVLANAPGVHDTGTAELALGLIHAAQRDLPEFVLAQQQGRWLGARPRRAVAGSRVLIVGYGGVGRALATRLLACEAEVTAVASRPREGDGLVGTVHGIAEVDRLLPEHDIVVLVVPLNETTVGLMGRSRLAALPDDALVVNIGRGPLVDTEALLAECLAGRLRAAVDVTEPEPLPAEHPLWGAPGVLISPHTGGQSASFLPRMTALASRQVSRLREGHDPDHVVFRATRKAGD